MSLADFEALVLSQRPADKAWEPVTDYSFDARKIAEGQHPQLIKDVFQPKDVLDVGAGFGHLVKMLNDLGVNATGCDSNRERFIWTDDIYIFVQDITDTDAVDCYIKEKHDLVICREVLEHLTVTQIRKAVTNLCALSSKFVYVTTRFNQNPSSLLDVATSDDLDPTHITMLNQDFLRLLFVLEGFKRRADLEERIDWQHKGRCLVYERAA
jgi:2-polyprenyl-3-methyl-5-hydroxy-6-metoxy-1,4-benzoquinol methylase